MSGQQPYFNITSDLNVVVYLHYRIKPARPNTSRLTDKHWELINRCWGERDDPYSRLSAQEVVVAISALENQTCSL